MEVSNFLKVDLSFDENFLKILKNLFNNLSLTFRLVIGILSRVIWRLAKWQSSLIKYSCAKWKGTRWLQLVQSAGNQTSRLLRATIVEKWHQWSASEASRHRNCFAVQEPDHEDRKGAGKDQGTWNWNDGIFKRKREEHHDNFDC